jgi:hypothetical protein
MRIILLNKPLFEFMYTHGSVEYVALQLSLRIAVCIYTYFFYKADEERSCRQDNFVCLGSDCGFHSELRWIVSSVLSCRLRCQHMQM